MGFRVEGLGLRVFGVWGLGLRFSWFWVMLPLHRDLLCASLFLQRKNSGRFRGVGHISQIAALNNPQQSKPKVGTSSTSTSSTKPFNPHAKVPRCCAKKMPRTKSKDPSPKFPKPHRASDTLQLRRSDGRIFTWGDPRCGGDIDGPQFGKAAGQGASGYFGAGLKELKLILRVLQGLGRGVHRI